jgi:hypothetical protein
MIQTLQICRWRETFESADTRKRERLKFFHAPSGCDSRGYLNLVSRFPQAEAMAAFGIFQALCQLSATLGRLTRGTFRNSDGSPMDIQQISCLLRIEKCHLSAALEILTDERIKWLEWVEPADNLPTICREHPGFVQGEGEGKGKGEGEERPLAEPEKTNPETLANPTMPAGHDEWSDTMPQGAAADFHQLETWINSLHPKWKQRPHFSRIEREELMANARIFCDLTDRDKALLARYMDAAISPDWGKFWQPDQRGQLVRSVMDVLSHADRWERECRKRKVATGLEVAGGVA